jgi:phage repressor protein C with HTH and peptisase S24 domain
MPDNLPMLTHADIWAAIDALARDYGLTASALARRAGLDPTTFNRSKRVTRDGKLRWPSTESVAKVLEATGASLARFVSYIDAGHPRPASATLPLIGLAQANTDIAAFDGVGRPVPSLWDEIPFPAIDDPHAWALEIAGTEQEPVLRDGDIAIVSPAAGIRRGDRIVLRTVAGTLILGHFLRQTARRIDVAAFDPAKPPHALAIEDAAWMARILWISQ